jgi:hypothetical protein
VPLCDNVNENLSQKLGLVTEEKSLRLARHIPYSINHGPIAATA